MFLRGAPTDDQDVADLRKVFAQHRQVVFGALEVVLVVAVGIGRPGS
jgi:hypothetical protein